MARTTSSDASAASAAFIADLFARARADAGLSQQQLAHDAGVSLGSVRALESGLRREPAFFTVGRVGEALRRGLRDVSPPAATAFSKQLERHLWRSLPRRR